MSRAVDCPNCNLKIGIVDPPEIQENIKLHQQVEELEKIPKIQSFVPSYQCPDGNCGENHKNKNYSRTVKGQCNNCNQFSVSNHGKCPWCNENDTIEEIDNDFLEDLGIRLPNTEILN